MPRKVQQIYQNLYSFDILQIFFALFIVIKLLIINDIHKNDLSYVLFGFVNLHSQKKLSRTKLNFWEATTTDESTMFCVKIGCFGLPRNFRVIWLFDKKRPHNRDFFSVNLVGPYSSLISL